MVFFGVGETLCFLTRCCLDRLPDHSLTANSRQTQDVTSVKVLLKHLSIRSNGVTVPGANSWQRSSWGGDRTVARQVFAWWWITRNNLAINNWSSQDENSSSLDSTRSVQEQNRTYWLVNFISPIALYALTGNQKAHGETGASINHYRDC